MVNISPDALLIAGAILVVGIALYVLWYQAEKRQQEREERREVLMQMRRRGK